jgi:hypothetical protein
MKDTQIKVCGTSYDIRFKPGEAMGGLIGSANFNTQEISVNTDHSLQTQKIAILHEILHILSDSYNLRWEEETVKFTTHALLALFMDNPKLAEDLMSHDVSAL